MYERELKEIKRIVEGIKGYKVIYLCLYGSQNYGLDINDNTYQSDIDTKAIVIPSLNDLICNSKPVSEVVELPDGQCDVKDIRMYIETLLKGNPSYIETLFSPYYLIDESFEKDFEFLRSNSEELVNALRCQFIRAMYGMMCEKHKALCYPYPTIKHKIEKYGYCYHKDTLFLTENGWKTFDEISDCDKLGTVNSDTLELEFQKPTNFIKHNNSNNFLYDVENNYTHFVVTEDHDVFSSKIINVNKNGIKYIENNCHWEKEKIVKFCNDNFNRHIISFPENTNKELDIEDEELILIGAFVSEGTIGFRKNKPHCLRITQTKNNSIFYKQMDMIMEKFNGKKYIYEKETIWVFKSNIAKKIYELCGHKSDKKTLPCFIYKLSKRQANILLDMLLLGDGTKDADGNRYIYYTTSKKLSNEMVSLGFLSGKMSNVIGKYICNNKYGDKPVYQVSIKNKKALPNWIHSKINGKQNHVKKIPYNDDVVCFTVPNGLLITMYDGKPAVQGNCGKQLHHMYRLWIMMLDYFQVGNPLSDCFFITDKMAKFDLLQMKLNEYTLEDAKRRADDIKKYAEQFKNDYLDKIDEKRIDYSIKKKYLDKSHEIIYNYIVGEIICQS